MMPTASSVPSAWKPPTRFITTSARKAICAGPPARLTERRKPGSTHSSTSGRQISASTISETLVMPTISSSVGSSTASTEPNRKCSRSTLVPLTETMVTPSASEIRKNAASEASSFSSVARAIRPAPTRDDEAGDQAAAGHREQAQARRPGSRSRRPAGWRAPWRRRSGSCAAASGTRRSAPRRAPARSVPTSARRMNSKSANGAMKRS